jgi:hypothetical protein
MKIKRFEQINEAFNDSDDMHVTEITRLGISLYNIEDEYNGITDNYVKKCVVYWRSEIDNRKSGIMGLTAFISKIVIDIELEYYNDDSDEATFEDKELVFDGADFEFEIDTDTLEKIPFLPENVYVDFKTKKINIEF